MPSETPKPPYGEHWIDLLVDDRAVLMPTDIQAEAITNARAELAALREQLKQARNAALDEAANLVKEHQRNYMSGTEGADAEELLSNEHKTLALIKIARAILALKGS